MPDEQFAELRAAHAKATPGKLRSVGFRLSHEANRNIDSTVFHLDEIGQIGSGPYQAIPFARREDAEWHAAVHNSFQELIAALDQARAERDDLRQRLVEAKDGLETRQVELHAALYCLELNGIASDEVRERLAARDARMKREGVITGIEQAREMLSMAESGEEADELMRAAATKLRQGGE